ncbi:type I-D CRISPR-associated protein Cas7/Csc2 [Ktedonosporobacter rubrisoli]|uniref:Type I-D CRISPR-associated protein Cas7/Csc2 n=1 Tax=Ktedonosporobacter rubrisoli TaxID=2509675 RepID=A0A4P6JZ96_KTERU|nr:type I-D CRISPR-associated protein Cas7/Csc2 [Ktedonosporobacter rubrisoli]QBD80770.1 type I-D CRISPR-associated protein Cas7/Csc2 [Ktedonosporobacter rubrisoli]
MFLRTIQQDVFHQVIPSRPMGKYAHIVILRETSSFALFRTELELNFAKVSAGRSIQRLSPIISRIVLYKRKQTSPERLTGRELLRRYNLISESRDNAELRYCEYNSEHFCKHCPDCIYYGFAIGQEGSEKSKIMVDSAFSLPHFDEARQTMTFNAPYEHGTMSLHGELKHSLGEQDHVLPQIFFPSIETIRDPTEPEFLYVLNNILRTRRYGAQTTRAGTVENHIAAIIFADGEIFSNLKLTQALYDWLQSESQTQPPANAYQAANLLIGIHEVLPTLLKEDSVVVHLQLEGLQLKMLLAEVNGLLTNESKLLLLLREAYAECDIYSKTFGAGSKSKK